MAADLAYPTKVSTRPFTASLLPLLYVWPLLYRWHFHVLSHSNFPPPKYKLIIGNKDTLPAVPIEAYL